MVLRGDLATDAEVVSDLEAIIARIKQGGEYWGNKDGDGLSPKTNLVSGKEKIDPL